MAPDPTTPPESNGPQISPIMMPLGGESLTAVADAFPERFPAGLELAIFEPGALAPLGKIHVPRGCMVAVVPPGMSAQLREAITRELRKRAQANPGPGQVAPPGLKIVRG